MHNWNFFLKALVNLYIVRYFKKYTKMGQWIKQEVDKMILSSREVLPNMLSYKNVGDTWFLFPDIVMMSFKLLKNILIVPKLLRGSSYSCSYCLDSKVSDSLILYTNPVSRLCLWQKYFSHSRIFSFLQILDL